MAYSKEHGVSYDPVPKEGFERSQEVYIHKENKLKYYKVSGEKYKSYGNKNKRRSFVIL